MQYRNIIAFINMLSKIIEQLFSGYIKNKIIKWMRNVDT